MRADARDYILQNIGLLRQRDFVTFLENVPYNSIELIVEYIDNKKIDYIKSIPVIYNGMYHNRSFTYFDIPENIKKIGSAAFAACKLKEIKIPKNVQEVALFAFLDCTDLEEIEIESLYTQIANGAFRGSLKNLRKLTVPKAWAGIEWMLFSYEDVDLSTVEIIYT